MIGEPGMFVSMALWVAIAIALAVAFSFFLRPAVRARFPGGERRYLAALVIQAAAFMIPIPFVLVMLLGHSILPYLDVALAVLAGVACVAILRFAPVTGPLLRDLARVRLEIALERAVRSQR